jgi:hypothetical protein
MMPVILANQEEEIKRIMVQSQLGQIVCGTLLENTQQMFLWQCPCLGQVPCFGLPYSTTAADSQQEGNPSGFWLSRPHLALIVFSFCSWDQWLALCLSKERESLIVKFGEWNLDLFKFPVCSRAFTDSLIEDLHLDNLQSLPSNILVVHYTIAESTHKTPWRMPEWKEAVCQCPHSTVCSILLQSQRKWHWTKRMHERSSFSIFNDYTYKFCKIKSFIFLNNKKSV